MRPSPHRLFLAAIGSGLVLVAGCAVTPPPGTVLPASPSAARTPAPAAGTSATPAPSVQSSSLASTTPATEAKPLTGKVIVIDPGHNGGWTAKFGYRKVPDGDGHMKDCNSSGTAAASGYTEHAYNWTQANLLAAVLRARGATVKLTRSSDTGQGPCIDKRASLANSLHADLMLSIHADGNVGRTHRGFHVIISPVMHGGKAIYKRSLVLAADVRADVQTEAGMPRSNYIGGGTAFSIRSDLGTLNYAMVPAVLVEMGNMMNASDEAMISSSAWRAKAAKALADGITKFLS